MLEALDYQKPLFSSDFATKKDASQVDRERLPPETPCARAAEAARPQGAATTATGVKKGARNASEWPSLRCLRRRQARDPVAGASKGPTAEFSGVLKHGIHMN